MMLTHLELHKKIRFGVNLSTMNLYIMVLSCKECIGLYNNMIGLNQNIIHMYKDPKGKMQCITHTQFYCIHFV